MKKISLWLIGFYQRTLSPDHGIFKARRPYGFCRFYPSCSEYTKQTIIKKGLWLGGVKGISRILRCNPFSRGGVDLP
ncbi:MAG: membrane protein insertion efficiency factor YidD [Candidatus Doudnabacteria bacterium]|nr:membrane protein insertion efficiency factor YidD [Candidatus Doudnabacteria bacterium]